MFGRVMHARRLLATAIAAIPVVGSLDYFFEHSNKLSAAEKDQATGIKVMEMLTQRMASVRLEGLGCEENTLIYARELAVMSEETVMGATALSEIKAQAAAQEAMQAQRIAKQQAKEKSCKENEVKKVQLSMESVEIQATLDQGEVFSEQTSQRVETERLLLNPLNHPAAMAFFALIRKP